MSKSKQNTPNITIVVPVYADWASLKECISSLQTRVRKNDQVILINDCGPDADMIEKNIKGKIFGYKNFKYYRNPKNLGFVGTCNRVVNELDTTNNNILLLNSDTKVTNGALGELLEVLNTNPNIGAVSPRSNNATICTIPISAIRQKGIKLKQSHELFKKYSHKFLRYSIAPTAHGFCMLIRREVISKYGLFDTAFGKGYGEEVDFCQRIKKHGWESAISNWSFVFHLEARSFSLETKQQILEINNKIIRKRYPSYQKQVKDYIDQALVKEDEMLNQDKPRPYTTMRIILKKSLAFLRRN